MVVRDTGDWAGQSWPRWTDLSWIRARLAAGADPDRGGRLWEPPLHDAAEFGSPEVVAELAARVSDVDALHAGRTALWLAVYGGRPDNARALVAAGADPWRPMMSGWSPARLSLAGPTPDLFAARPGAPGLTPAEAAAATEAGRLIGVLGRFHHEGLGIACVAGIDVAEAARRLGASPVEEDVAEFLDEEVADFDDLTVVGATDVPGGVVLTQPWGYAPNMPGVSGRLSAGTTCYAMYANPKSGNQGSILVDGVVEGWDLHPGGHPGEADPPELVLASYLYQGHAVAYCCAYAGLRLTDRRAVAGPSDVWLRLPERDWWRWP